MLERKIMLEYAAKILSKMIISMICKLTVLNINEDDSGRAERQKSRKKALESVQDQLKTFSLAKVNNDSFTRIENHQCETVTKCCRKCDVVQKDSRNLK